MSKAFSDAIHRANMTQRQFADIVDALSGCKPIARQRISYWAKQTTKPNEAAIALAELVARISPTEFAQLVSIPKEQFTTNEQEH